MNKTESLEQKIQAAVEELVCEHLTKCESLAASAVAQAFRRSSRPSPRRSQRGKKSGRSSSQRRSPDEIASLKEQLYEAISQHPGETMSVIASSMAAVPRELSLPVTQLRRDGRIRSVGKRQGTRYFPMSA